MKVLLIGGFGFLGKRFIRKFSSIHEIIVYSRHEDVSSVHQYFRDNVLIEEGTVEEKKVFDIITKHNPKVVIHLAALTGLKKCNDDPELAFKINVYGTYNVVRACLKARCKMIFISSREVYGDTMGKESAETDLLNPNNIYGLTKMLGEDIVKNGGRCGLDYTILRPTNIYGPEGDKYGAQIIIKNAIKLHKVQILGGNQKLNYVYVDDVVELINQVLTDRRSSKQIFNIGSNDTLTIEQFVSKVINTISEKIEVEYLPMRQNETLNFVPSLKKLKNILEFSARYSISEGIEETKKWYLSN